MTTRQIISYDDITLPPADCKPSPAKKRKKNNKKARQVDKPAPKVTAFSTSALEGEVVAYDEEESSRELTREEIWDDSALVDAWEIAQQEYEMYHGTGKDWKNEPVKKSPLWYNIPVDQAAKRTNEVPTAKSSTAVIQSDNIEPAEPPDSQPLNFDTFVPSHDPSLSIDPSNYAVGTSSGSMVCQDEAFSRAMNAMYWGGYWTAVYHRNLSNSTVLHDDAAENGVDEPEAAKGPPSPSIYEPLNPYDPQITTSSSKITM